ncbi:MAG: gamma-glutamylcyclotransferase family protein [Planctomycetota bacterium]
MQNLFAYGTLMFPEVAVAVSGISSPGEEFTLSGYRRYEARIRTSANFPAIIEDAGASVDGLLFRNLSNDQIRRLDWFEEVANGLYQRRAQSVRVREEKLSVWFYVCGPALKRILLEPLSKPWCPESFEKKELQWYLSHVVRPAVDSESFQVHFGERSSRIESND